MSWFNLSPEQLAKDRADPYDYEFDTDAKQWRYKERGEGSARVLDRLADQDEEEGLDDEAEEEHAEADEARAAKAVRVTEVTTPEGTVVIKQSITES